VNIYAAYDNRTLNAHIDGATEFDDILFINPKDLDCYRKNGGKPRHIMIEGQCAICGGITEQEFEDRREAEERSVDRYSYEG